LKGEGIDNLADVLSCWYRIVLGSNLKSKSIEEERQEEFVAKQQRHFVNCASAQRARAGACQPFIFPFGCERVCAATRKERRCNPAIGTREQPESVRQIAGSRVCSVNRKSHRAVPLELIYLLVPELPDDPEPEDPDVPELLPVPPLLLEPVPVPPELLPEPDVPEPEVPLELEPLPPTLEPLPVPPVALLLVLVFFFEVLLPEPAEPLEPLPVAPLLLEPLPLAPLLPDVPLEGVFWAIACAARNAAAAIINPSRFILLCCLLVLARRITERLLFV
jgi:hypothetical protein